LHLNPGRSIGIWILEFKDGRFWATYPGDFQTISTEQEVRKIIKELPTFPEKLSRSQLIKVAEQNKASIQSCHQGKGGIVVVKIKISKDGSVQSAKVEGKFSGTQIGNCIEEKTYTLKFPRSTGDFMSFSIPFVL